MAYDRDSRKNGLIYILKNVICMYVYILLSFINYRGKNMYMAKLYDNIKIKLTPSKWWCLWPGHGKDGLIYIYTYIRVYESECEWFSKKNSFQTIWTSSRVGFPYWLIVCSCREFIHFLSGYVTSRLKKVNYLLDCEDCVSFLVFQFCPR